MKPLFKLTEEQSVFTTYSVANPRVFIVIKARAGTGKTATLIIMLDPLSALGESIGFFAFGNKNAAELRKKIGELGITNCEVIALTCHSHSFAALRTTGFKFFIPKKKRDLGKWVWDAMEYLPHVGRMSNRDIEEVTQDKMVINRLIHFTRVTLTDYKDPEAIQEMALRRGLDLGNSPDENVEAVSMLLVNHEQELTKNKGGEIDFDDQLWLPIIWDLEFKQYMHVIVDEGQDTSAIMREVYARTILRDSDGNIIGRLITVGDDWQAIMSFAGADNGSLKVLGERFDCKEFKLTENFRCSIRVVLEAKKLVPDFRYHKGAPLGLVAYCNNDYFREHVTKGDMIVCRTKAPLVPICFSLIKEGKPAYIEGKDVGEEIINVIKNASKIMHKHNIMFEDALTSFAEKEEERMKKRKYLATTIEGFKDKIEVIRALLSQGMDESQVAQSIKSLFKEVIEWKNGRLTENPGIVLSSIHKQKGAEATNVWIIDINKIRITKDGMTQDELEQEAHLEYVAKTRAKMNMYYVDPDGVEFEEVPYDLEEEVIEVEAEVIKPEPLTLETLFE